MVQDSNKHEQKLQAVLLADSFTSTFRPITLGNDGTPKVLCPLNNVALLDYSIEFLAGSGVKELFIFCVNHADKVEQYVSQGVTCSQYSNAIKVHCIKDPNCTSAGDALRHLDSTNLIRSDPFILMSGDIVSNVDIVNAMEEHRLRHKKDSSAIMTIVFQKSNHASRTSLRHVNDDLIVAFSRMKEGSRVLLYDNDVDSSQVAIPSTFFNGNSVEIRNDLIDTGISICSPDVLARFSDEFDYRDIQRQFVRNSVAEEEEGLQNRIYAHFLAEGEYAARIHDPRTYATISRHLLKRWAFPVVPDNPPSGYEKYYRYKVGRNYVYREVKGITKIARSTTIGAYSMIGADVVIGEEGKVKGTVIGNNCVIHDKVSIADSFLWEDVTVEENVTIMDSIICDGAVVKKGAVINKGCILGNGVIVGENVVLPEFTRLTLSMKVDEESDDDEFSSDDDDFDDDFDDDVISYNEAPDREALPSLNIVGVDGKGHLWHADIDSDSDSDEEDEDKELKANINCIGFDASPIFNKRFENYLREEADDMSIGVAKDEISMASSGPFNLTGAESIDTGFSPMMIVGRQKGVDVVKELKNLILEHEDDASIDNLAIELNSFKFSQNASFADCATAATQAVVEKMDITSSMSDIKLVGSLKSQLQYFGPLFTKFCHEESDEVAVVKEFELLSLEGSSSERLKKSPSFRFILQTLHDMDIVSEGAILSWAISHENTSESAKELFLQQTTQDFLEWLREDSDDSDDSDSEDSDGSEDSD